MNLMLYKDGRLVISEQGKPLEGDEQNLDGLYAYITDPKDGDSIVYDAASGTWKTGAGGGGSFSPDITDPQDGQTLVYDGTAGKWVNGAGGGTCGLMVVNVTYDEQDDEYSADKTYAEIVAHISAGGYVVLRNPDGLPIEEEPLDKWYTLHEWGRTATSGNVRFGMVEVYPDAGVSYAEFVISFADEVSKNSYNYPES